MTKLFDTHMKKNYNYTRRKLFLPEYGRHIHEMVDSLLTIEDRAERTRQAKAVIAVMGNLNPLLRDTADFTHKLWDHLFIMSDFKLDVDSPYPQPSRQELTVVPRKMKYSQSRITFKHYGKYTQQFIRSMAKDSGMHSIDEEMLNIARYMRTKSFEYNNEHPNNEIIIKDIRLMAGGSISLDEASIGNIRSEYRTVIPQRMMRNGQRNNKNQGQKNRQNRQQKSNNKNVVRHNSYK